MKDALYNTKEGRTRLLDELTAIGAKRVELERKRGENRQHTGRGHADDDECGDLDNLLISCIARQGEIQDIFSVTGGNVAPPPTNTLSVQLGSVVTVRRFANDSDNKGELYTFQLVGHGEGMATGNGAGLSPKLPLISYTCPQGEAVLRKEVGDEVVVNGKDQEIVAIQLLNTYQELPMAA